MKIEKKLIEWQKDIWLIPELAPEPKYSNNKNEYFLKISEAKAKEFKQVIKNSNIDKEFITAGKEALAKIASNENINFLQEEDSQLSKYNLNEKNHNYLINKLKKRKNAKKYEKNTNQILIESLDKRAQTLQYLYSNYSENTFQNNVNILKKINKDIYFTQIGLGLSSLRQKKGLNNDNNNDNENKNGEDNQQQFKNKLDAIKSNFEEEKKAKNEEIAELNTRLLNITNNIDTLKNTQKDNAELKTQLQETLVKLSEENTELLKEIEDEMAAYEQMKKLQKNEIGENEVINEVEKLEKKISRYDKRLV